MILHTLDEIEAEIARRSLKDFIKQAWHVLEPDVNYLSAWHIDAIAEHLEACTSGKINKLVINIPPGHCKSLLTSVFWPAWMWANNPAIKIICGAYGIDLSMRDSIKTRTLIESEWYQNFFGRKFKLLKTNEKTLTNDKTGFRIATSIGGAGTGFRANIVINDDLVNVTDARSDAMLEQAISHMQSMSTRGIAGQIFAQVLIMQRVSEKDPAAWAFDRGWEGLVLPARFETNRKIKTSIGFVDPRKEEGELLWPELFGEDKLKEIEKGLGQYEIAAQLQQRPAPVEGGLIKLKNIRLFKSINEKIDYYIQSWDTAFKTGKENDFSVCTTWGVSKTSYYLVDRYKSKVEFPDLKKIVIALANQYNPSTILVEDKASGQSLIQELKRDTRLPIKPIKVDVDKIARVNASLTVLEENAYVKEDAEWVKDYLDNLLVFPNGAHDDDIDSTTQALMYLSSVKKRNIYTTNVNIFGR